MIRFKDISVGDTFNFKGSRKPYKFHYEVCRKMNPLSWEDDEGLLHNIGSENTTVYNVLRKRRINVYRHNGRVATAYVWAPPTASLDDILAQARREIAIADAKTFELVIGVG